MQENTSNIEENISMKKNTSKKKKILISLVIIILIILAIIGFLIFRKVLNTPTLTLMPPAPLKASNYDEFTVDIKFLQTFTQQLAYHLPLIKISLNLLE